MAEVLVSPIVADSLICERINQLADEIVAVGRGMAVQMHQPGDTAESYKVAGLSQALQAALASAHRSGMDDAGVFMALATAIGFFANAQQLAEPDKICAQLGFKGAYVAALGRQAAVAGFPTRGTA